MSNEETIQRESNSEQTYSEFVVGITSEREASEYEIPDLQSTSLISILNTNRHEAI